jgi:Diacylglycerol kinase catalytic domain
MTPKQMLQQRIEAERSAVLIVNAHSRRGEALFEAARDALRRRGLTVSSAYAVRDPVRLPDTVREAIASGSPLVVVGGGDGTISSVVDYFAEHDVVLGILPLRTGNSARPSTSSAANSDAPVEEKCVALDTTNPSDWGSDFSRSWYVSPKRQCTPGPPHDRVGLRDAQRIRLAKFPVHESRYPFQTWPARRLAPGRSNAIRSCLCPRRSRVAL